MKVLYVSKAMRVAAYRGKLDSLARMVDLEALIPLHWDGKPEESGPAGDARLPYVLHERPVRWPGRNHFHWYSGVSDLIRGVDPDLVHIDEEPYSLVTWQVSRACRRLGLPCLFFAWQNLPKRIPPPFSQGMARVFSVCRGGIAGTEAAARVLRRWGFEGSLAVIPQVGVDPSLFRPDTSAGRQVRKELGIPDSAVVVGFVGRLIPEKGVQLLVRAMVRLPGAYLVLVGDGPGRAALERDVQSAGLGDRTRFVGAVESLAVPRWLQAFDMLALPSLTSPGWTEQFGRVLIEAMACQVPVVGSDSGEIPRVIDAGGLTVREGDVEALAGALARLAEDGELRASVGRTGRARVLDRFTHEKIAADTVEFYRSVLGGGAPGGESAGSGTSATAAAGPGAGESS